MQVLLQHDVASFSRYCFLKNMFLDSVLMQQAMLFILSTCQIVVPDLLLHLGAVGGGSPIPALEEEEEPEEESQGLIEWSVDDVL